LFSPEPPPHIDRQRCTRTDRQTEIYKERQTDRQNDETKTTHRQTDRDIQGQTDRQHDETDHTQTDSTMLAQVDWVVKAVITLGLVLSYTTATQTDRQTEIYKDRQTDRQTA